MMVRRLHVGDTVILFENTGAEHEAVIVEVERGKHGPIFALSIKSSIKIDREAPVRVLIATAIPKGERADWMIQKCAELGCHALVPMECARSVVHFTTAREGKIQRWRRIALEASKQCGRNRVMEVHEPTSFQNVLSLIHAHTLGIICAPDPKTLPNLLAEKGHPKDIMCLVGPEGGFTDVELKQAQAAGCLAAGLARSILRTETAAVAAMAIIGAAYL